MKAKNHEREKEKRSAAPSPRKKGSGRGLFLLYFREKPQAFLREKRDRGGLSSTAFWEKNESTRCRPPRRDGKGNSPHHVGSEKKSLLVFFSLQVPSGKGEHKRGGASTWSPELAEGKKTAVVHLTSDSVRGRLPFFRQMPGVGGRWGITATSVSPCVGGRVASFWACEGRQSPPSNKERPRAAVLVLTREGEVRVRFSSPMSKGKRPTSRCLYNYLMRQRGGSHAPRARTVEVKFLGNKAPAVRFTYHGEETRPPLYQ